MIEDRAFNIDYVDHSNMNGERCSCMRSDNFRQFSELIGNVKRRKSKSLTLKPATQAGSSFAKIHVGPEKDEAAAYKTALELLRAGTPVHFYPN